MADANRDNEQGADEGPLGGRRHLGYGVILLAFRLLIALLALLWMASEDATVAGRLRFVSASDAQSILVALYCLYTATAAYCLYSLLVYAVGPRNPRAHAVGSFLDLVAITVLVTISGGAASPFLALYAMVVALAGFHFGLAVGVIQGLVSGVLCLIAVMMDSPGTTRLGVLFAVTSPLVVGVCAGVLRRGRDALREREARPFEPRPWASDTLAGYLCWAGTQVGRRPPRAVDQVFGEAFRAAWTELGVGSVAVFSRGASGLLELTAFYNAPELAGEEGELQIKAADVDGLSPGMTVLHPGSAIIRILGGSFSSLSRGHGAAILGSDASGPAVLAVACSHTAAYAAEEAAALKRMGSLVADFFRRVREETRDVFSGPAV